MDPNQNQSNDPSSAPETPETPAPETPVTEPAPEATPEQAPLPPEQAPVPVVDATQPAPAPSPVAENAPLAPIGGAPTPAPKSKKGLLIGLIAAGAAVLLIVTAVIVYFAVFAVTKADYQAAQTQLLVTREIADLDGARLAGSGSSVSAIEDAEAKLAELKVEHKKLADLKAVKQDGDVREKFVAYDEKVTAYFAFADQMLPSLKVMFEASEKQKTVTSGTFSQEKIAELVKIYRDAAADITEPTLKKSVTALADAFEEVEKEYEIYASPSSSPAERLAASRKISSAISKASSNSATAEMKKKAEDINPQAAYDALKAVIDEKAL